MPRSSDVTNVIAGAYTTVTTVYHHGPSVMTGWKWISNQGLTLRNLHIHCKHRCVTILYLDQQLSASDIFLCNDRSAIWCCGIWCPNWFCTWPDSQLTLTGKAGGEILWKELELSLASLRPGFQSQLWPPKTVSLWVNHTTAEPLFLHKWDQRRPARQFKRMKWSKSYSSPLLATLQAHD